MPDGAQFDLSQVGQDSGFRSATMPDRIAYLSSIDPDFAKASAQDKAGYINHLLGNDKPTQFEQQRNPANQPGFWSSALGAVKDIAGGVANLPFSPNEIASSTLHQAGQMGLDAAARQQAGRSTAYQIAAPAAQMLVPGLNPAAMEQAADVGNRKAILAQAAVPATLAAAPLAAKEAIGAVAPKTANALDASAAKNYQDVLNPTRIDTKYQTQKIMPKLLEERPVAMTRQGLANKAAANAEAAGQQVENAVSNLSGSMKTQPVIDGLENLRQKYQVNGVSLRPEVNSAIDAMQDQLRNISEPGQVSGGAQGPGEPSISYQDTVKARRILDDAVAEVGGYQGRPLSDTSLANIRKATANSFREELSNASPDLAAVNAKFHFWNTLSDVLDATIQRKTGQVNALPKVETVIAGAGGLARGGLTAAAGYGAAMKALGAAFRSTAWRTISAATKSGIADALASGNFNQVNSLLGKAGIVAVSSKRFSTNGDLYDDATVDQYEQQHRRF